VLVRAWNAQPSGMHKKILQRECVFCSTLDVIIPPSLLLRTANACYKDAADLHAQLEEYPQAIARYEQVADSSLTSPLTKHSVKEYWLKATLCALAMDVSIITSIIRCWRD